MPDITEAQFKSGVVSWLQAIETYTPIIKAMPSKDLFMMVNNIRNNPEASLAKLMSDSGPCLDKKAARHTMNLLCALGVEEINRRQDGRL